VSIRRITAEDTEAVRTAPMIALPAVAGTAQGTVLHVRSVGILPEPPAPYVRTVSGEVYRLPADLYPWADSVMSACIHGRPGDAAPVLPAFISFGIRGGEVRAEPAEHNHDQDQGPTE